MSNDLDRYINLDMGSWSPIGVAQRRSKSGGKYLIVKCKTCGYTDEKDAQLLKNRAPTCPQCRRGGVEKKERRLVVFSEGKALVLEGIDHQRWLNTLKIDTIQQFIAANATLYSGFRNEGLDQVDNPWSHADAALKAEKDALLTEQERIISQRLAELDTLLATGKVFEKEVLLPPSAPHFVIRECDKDLFEDGHEARAIPAYIDSMLAEFSDIENYGFTFEKAPEGQLYVLWYRKERAKVSPELEIAVPNFEL